MNYIINSTTTYKIGIPVSNRSISIHSYSISIYTINVCLNNRSLPIADYINRTLRQVLNYRFAVICKVAQILQPGNIIRIPLNLRIQYHQVIRHGIIFQDIILIRIYRTDTIRQCIISSFTAFFFSMYGIINNPAGHNTGIAICYCTVRSNIDRIRIRIAISTFGNCRMRPINDFYRFFCQCTDFAFTGIRQVVHSDICFSRQSSGYTAFGTCNRRLDSTIHCTAAYKIIIVFINYAVSQDFYIICIHAGHIGLGDSRLAGTRYIHCALGVGLDYIDPGIRNIG